VNVPSTEWRPVAIGKPLLCRSFNLRALTRTLITAMHVADELNKLYPCREDQFAALSSILGDPSLPSPPVVLLTGPPSQGKSTITDAFLDDIKAQSVWVDCSETLTSALLFNRIVNSLRALAEKESRVKMQGDLNKFTVEVHKALEALQGKVILVCN